MMILEDKWNESLQQELKEEAVTGLLPSGSIADNGRLQRKDCDDRERGKTSGKKNCAITGRVSKGEDLVWSPVLEGLEYLTILLLQNCFARQYLDKSGRKSIRL